MLKKLFILWFGIYIGFFLCNASAEDHDDILGRGSSDIKSFDEAPYINPFILLDFAGWTLDGVDDVLLVSIDLPAALISDRYYVKEAKIITIDDQRWVYASNDSDWVRYRLYDENNNVFIIQVVHGPIDGKLSFRDNLIMNFSIDRKFLWNQNISRMRYEEILTLNCLGKLPFDFFDGDLSIEDVFSEENGKESLLGKVMENGMHITKLNAQYPDLVKKWSDLLASGDEPSMGFEEEGGKDEK